MEEHKKKLADKVTKEVFAEHDMRWNTQAEINKIIKTRLRERYQKESIEVMIEIIDLEAKVIRAPLTMVIEKIKKSVSQYVKYCTEKSMAG